MKRILTLLAVGTTLISSAQINLSSFTTTGRGGATTFATDYQAVGINPANLGWTWKFEEKKFALGLNEMTYSIHSEALTKQELRDEVKYAVKNRTMRDFTYDEKIQAAKDFADAGLAFNADYGSIGAAFTHEKIGGIAFRINDHFQWYSQLGPTTSELVFLGKHASYFDSLVIYDGTDTTVVANDQTEYPDSVEVIEGFRNIPQMMSEILDGSRMSMQWYREYNLSYGRKIFQVDSVFELYGGVGIKYLQGIALMEISAPNGELNAYSAISPFFDIDYGSAADENPSAMPPQEGGLPNSVGSGWGADFGINMILFNKLKLGLAVTNIGSITWDGNVYSVKDTFLYSTNSDGIENYNIFNAMDDFAGEDGYLQWEGQQKRTVDLPTVFRTGASFKIKEFAEIGVDILIPTKEVPGDLTGAVIGFGGDIRPVPWLSLQAGFLTGGNYDAQIPVGFVVTPPAGSYEFGFASRDAITFFTQNGPTLSMSFGFMRFRF